MPSHTPPSSPKSSQEPVHTVHDRCFRSLMRQEKMAKAFFKAYLPLSLQKTLDWERLTLEEASFVTEDLKNYEGDILYKTHLLNETGKQPVYLYTLVEHQTSSDRWMPLRIVEYTLRIMRQHLHQGHPHLPVVYPLVYHCADKPYTASCDILDLFGSREAKAFAQTYLFKPFQLVELSKLSAREMRQHGLAGVLDFFLKFAHVPDTLPEGVEYIEALLCEVVQQGEAHFITQGLHYLLRAVDSREKFESMLQLAKKVSTELENNMTSLAEQFEQKGLERGKMEGLAKGLEKGKLEEKYAIAKNLLMLDALDIKAIAQATELSLEELKRLEKTLLH